MQAHAPRCPRCGNQMAQVYDRDAKICPRCRKVVSSLELRMKESKK